MENLLKTIEILDLLLNDIPKKYQFLDAEKLKNDLNEIKFIIKKENKK